jgi:potassium-transporting ATPase KdpC subunit
MMRNALRALLATVVLAVITGLLYPLAMTGFAQVAFHSKAEGSLEAVDGKPVGSRLIGQKWEGDEWFYGRPSAVDYDASTSSGSNLGPLSADLAKAITERAEAILKIEGPFTPGLSIATIPVDLLLASASGLDPDISAEAALFQAPRIAAVRHLSIESVRALIDEHTASPPLHLFGDPHVNVLELNLALSRLGSGTP